VKDTSSISSSFSLLQTFTSQPPLLPWPSLLSILVKLHTQYNRPLLPFSIKLEAIIPPCVFVVFLATTLQAS